MPVRRDATGTWRFRKMVTLPDGRKVRLSGTPEVNAKVAAEAAERAAVEKVLGPGAFTPRGEVPTFSGFVTEFLTYCTAHNRESEVSEKRSIIDNHLRPAFGGMKLDAIGSRQVEQYTARKLKGDDEHDALSPKTVKNHQTVLHRMFSLARRWGLIRGVPEFAWVKVPKPGIEFLDFEESRRLEAGAEPGWAPMIGVGLRTGLRHGELLGLRWGDVDLVAGRLFVRQAICRGRVGLPKSGKAREVPLSEEAAALLKAARHDRGPLVFCDETGAVLTAASCRRPLERACRAAGLRLIGWHVLRHTFASHLVMRGVPMRAVQELLGHATVTMTDRYAHLSPAVGRDAVRALDSPRRGNQVATDGTGLAK